MATFIVTSDGSQGAEGLTFNDAIAAANGSPEADTILFDASLVVVEMSDVAAITGELIINGDRDGDGISDIIVKAASSKRHLSIGENANVTIKNVDFVEGYDKPRTYEGVRQPAEGGEDGNDGTTTPGTGLNGANGNDDATDGGPGADGVDGVDAGGSIVNEGALLLERVGFGGNEAYGERAEPGGFGGDGGWSRAGNGQTDDRTQLRPSIFPNLFEDDFIPGGIGGDAGRGGNGGDGGDGGNGGYAGAAILNRGNLTLVDTVFGGRLTSGVYANGNEATGGAAGDPGNGGLGGSSYGGNGGDSGRDYTGETRVVTWDIPESFWDEPWANAGFSAQENAGDPDERRYFGAVIRKEITNEAGVGGDGGQGGSGGDGGDGGKGGGAGTIVNFGSLTGKAALLPDVGRENFLVNESIGGAAGDKGVGRAGGESVGGDGGLELGDVESIEPVPIFDLGFLEVSSGVAFVEDIRDEIRGWDLKPVGSPFFPVTGQAAFGDAGPTGTTGSDGSPGFEGEAVVGVLTAEDGASVFSSTATLVYLYNLGQDLDTGQLAFNIIRLGNFWTEFTVNWQLTGTGGSPVSVEDFAPGTALSGSVEFVFAEVTPAQGDGTYAQRYAATDNSENMFQVVLDVAADGLSEVPEGYQIILSLTDSSITLGTDTASGTVVDTMLSNELSGTVADGYVSGARIYVDSNSDGLPDPGEDTGITTDAGGNFVLPDAQATGPILAVGGTNIDTGLPNSLILSAPQGAPVVNPITTLIQEVLYAEGGTTADAEAKVQTALDIQAEVDLTSYDPLAQDPDDEDALAAQKLAAQIAVLATLSDDTDAFSDIAAYLLANPGLVVDFTDPDTLLSMLPGVDPAVLAQAVTVNQVLAGAGSFAEISATQSSGLNESNDAPVVDGEIDLQLAYGNAGFNLQAPTGLFIDLDAGDTLTYSASLADDTPLPDWLSFNGQTQTFSGTPDNNDIDRLAVKLTATDTGDVSAATTFDLVVQMDSTLIDNLDGSNGFRLDGVAGLDRAGWSVSGAGDFNGDGFDDLLIGGFRADPNGNDSGTAYLVFGKADGFDASSSLGDLDGINGFRLDGLAAGDWTGWSVSGAGDVNGDGFDDLIIGAPDADPEGRNDAGISYVVFGKADGFSANFDLASLNGSNGFVLEGDLSNDQSGGSVSSAGDINGDGFDDVVVGASDADYNGSSTGAGYVVFGKADGFAATLNLGSLNGTDGFRLQGMASFDRLGESVSSAGDVNGDGFDDLIVGGWGADNNGDSSGSAYIVFGKATAFAATLDVDTLDGSGGFRLDGAGEDHDAGYSVSHAGDINNDGIDDVIVSAYQAGFNGLESGSAYVVFGSAEGFPAAVTLGDLDGSDGFRLDGVAPDYNTGETVSSAGDINGDGIDDLLVGAWRTDIKGNLTGSTYAVFGSNSAFASVLQLSNLNGSTGFRLDGENAGDLFGYFVSTAGDVNNDGVDDLLVGAPSADFAGNLSGSAYVVFGTDLTGIVVEGGPENDTLVGSALNDTLLGNGGNDTLEGLAGNDLLDGGDGIDFAWFQWERDDYAIANNADVLTVSGPVEDGADSLINLERVVFSDSGVAFDLDGNAGNSAKLLGVLTGAVDAGLMGVALDIFDNANLTFSEVMAVGLDVVLGTERSNSDVVNMIFSNLVGQAPSQADLNALTADLLDSGAFTQVELAVLAADHPLNTDLIDLVGLTESGVEYIPVI